ncbi:MAG: DUF721 domain-containing protein [Rhodospirillaceae bacterium]|nr:DUF721 domain-containing protein [Rhodospirillaceae bacterium]
MSAKVEKSGAGKPAKPPAREAAEAKPRRNRLSALASDVPALTKLALGKRGFAEADLIGQWARIVGPDLARLALPVKLRLPRHKAMAPGGGGVAPNVAGGTLTLRASPAASLEVQHLKPRFLERIATYFGYPAVSEIRLEIGDRRRPPAPRKAAAEAPPPDLGTVSDPEIRAALQRLGAARGRQR